MVEQDLYAPVKAYFEGLGYQVNGEVKDCDLTAVKDEHLVIVEFKRQFGLPLLYQGLDRQKMARDVYLCIPRPGRESVSANRKRKALLKKCGLGLITVALDSPVPTVDVRQHPDNGEGKLQNRKRTALLKEIAGRSGDYNTGGSTKVRIKTAYLEKALHIACVLAHTGPLSPKKLITHGCAPKAGLIVSRNVYGWFEKVEKGVYGLSAKGEEALQEPDLAPLVHHYQQVFSDRNREE